MPSQKSVSFREPLVARAGDLIAEIELNCAWTPRLVAALVSKIAAYTEEGVPLTPNIYICNSIEQLVKRVGAGEFISLTSDGISSDGSASRILKSAAPLCNSNWNVYVERVGDGRTCKFGVFCGSTDPSALSVEEVILAEYERGFPIIRISQNAVNRVEVRTNIGSSVEFRFNDDADVDELTSRANIGAVAGAISSCVENDAEGFRAYVNRLLIDAVERSHGALVAVLPADISVVPEALSDCVGVSPTIDLYSRYAAHMVSGKTSDSVSALQAASELAAGFVGSDGITVFNASGKIVAYRAFVQSGAHAPSSGGARTRAYASLKTLVGKQLVAALFRSQDGRTEVEIAEVNANG